ncbi:AlwI family type II restriction endonuclease [Mammaliicoccus sciuri]|uniref:AlwI family type II restriction endonuclease n=1 Tax=Mammaliicoccus sciuri TaxID=1296 RepID=UPI002DB687C1|nr:AlwI family type II restriction endonuclease [Mammaliicoccus sciuri]MEB8133547.1 AlwI family type II restriction endonuclease [Mammaliicoccus sciuri]
MKKMMRKPLSFSTTMRNPDRISTFLKSIEEFDGEILTNILIKKIISKWIIGRLIRPDTALRIKPEYKSIYNSKINNFTESQAHDIFEITEQNTKGHKEAGFDRGWPSRFDTYMSLPKELGFIYYKMNEPIEISETGYLLISTTDPDMSEAVAESDVFLNALVKYQTNNPFRRNTVNNAPFVLFLNTIHYLTENYNWKKRGIYRHEIPFFTCWPNDDEKALANYIDDFRKRHGLRPSSEIVYDLCLEILKTDNRKRYKFKQITVEGVDDFIRKFRVTGVVSLRGGGYLIDINQYEIEKIKYVLNNYIKYHEYDNEYDFYQYMGKIDQSIITAQTEVSIKEVKDKKIEQLETWANELTFADLKKEFTALETGSKHPILKFISAPTRFEFLTSIALKKVFIYDEILPNYSIDDEGMPTNHAQGGMGDIEVFSKNSDVLVEVTLMKNRSQATNEIPAITRHLQEFSEGKKKTIFSIFVAPSMHTDTEYMIGYTHSRYNLNIIPIINNEFINILQKTTNIEDILEV